MKFGWIIRLGLPALTNLVMKWHLIIGPPDAGYLRGEAGLTIGFGNKEVIIGEVSLETVSIWVMQSEWEQNLIITLFSLPSPWHQYPIIVPIPGVQPNMLLHTCSMHTAAKAISPFQHDMTAVTDRLLHLRVFVYLYVRGRFQHLGKMNVRGDWCKFTGPCKFTRTCQSNSKVQTQSLRLLQGSFWAETRERQDGVLRAVRP